MESSSPLAIESFSYSWLSNEEPPLYGAIDEPIRKSLDSFPESMISNFNFAIPNSQSSASLLIHADELFSDGLIKPVFAGPSNAKASNASSDLITVLPAAGSSFSLRNRIPVLLGHYRLLIKWRISSQKIFRKCFGYFRTRCHKFRSSRKSSRVDDTDRRGQEVKSWSNSPQASPQLTTKYSAGDWVDIENSIYEAILHCKRTIGK